MTKNLDDNYMGSGRRLANAKKKYGIENFKKEILSFHETPEEMLAEEARLVNEEFIGRADVYNLTVGGKGSWFWINASGLCIKNFKDEKVQAKIRGKLAECRKDPLFKELHNAAISNAIKKRLETHDHVWVGKTHSDETKQLMSKSHHGKHDGDKNSQFGTCWVSRQGEVRKIKQQDLNQHLQDGWIRGRKHTIID